MPSSLAIYCTRCGEIAALMTVPSSLPVAPADGQFVLRQAARLLTRKLPEMRSVLEHAIAGRYRETLRELQSVYDARALSGSDALLCGVCVQTDRAIATDQLIEATHTIETTRVIENGEPVMVTTTRRIAATVSR